MGNPKHRWTLEEENALRAGVDKYGTGRWRSILSDEEFAPCLTDRSNVDLKDKWRNLCGNASTEAGQVEVNIAGEAVVQDYVKVLREVGYEEHEINVVVEQVEVLDELSSRGHVESPMSMNIEDNQDACLIDDTQESILKPKFLLKLVFKALKKLMLALKTSVQKLMLKIVRSCKF